MNTGNDPNSESATPAPRTPANRSGEAPRTELSLIRMMCSGTAGARRPIGPDRPALIRVSGLNRGGLSQAPVSVQSKGINRETTACLQYLDDEPFTLGPRCRVAVGLRRKLAVRPTGVGPAGLGGIIASL